MDSAAMNREQLERWLTDTILDIEENVSREQVVGSASLFYDLGLDSLAFERLLAAVERVAPVDLTQWYASVTEGGDDTLQGLIEFLLGVSAELPAGGRS